MKTVGSLTLVHCCSLILQGEAQNGAAIPARFGPYLAAMRLDDRAADRQAHAHPLGLVVKNWSNTWSIKAPSMPGPVSATSTSTAGFEAPGLNHDLAS
jgi:hypothetical protein